MEGQGIKHCVEMSWWEEVELPVRGRSSEAEKEKEEDSAKTIRVASTPAYHWTTRTPFDRNSRCIYLGELIIT